MSPMIETLLSDDVPSVKTIPSSITAPSIKEAPVNDAPVKEAPVNGAAVKAPAAFPAPFNKRQIPPSGLTALYHPLAEKTIKEVNDFFLEHWPFESEKYKSRFGVEGWCRVTCYYVCQSLDDRLALACRLVVVLFLIDDILESMSLDEGRAYNARLMPIFRGDELPDRNVPVEWISYDIWQDLRACDRELADEMLEPVFAFMRAQTDPIRLQKLDLGSYLEYREADVGKGVLSALIRYTGALRLSAEELAIAKPVDRNCARHLSVINDIWSYEKEVHAAAHLHEEGGVLCTSVAILAEEAHMSIDSSKRVLYQLCREWEISHEVLVEAALAQKDTPDMRAYLLRIEYQMAGNEFWSRTTPRYLNPTY
ncbi:Uu.00g005000.m01.CDS01 [Anthostomella pinea]|uniref:Uu.00g005000.m01.CDS01 n=1 Tax=Anthostomella pinea TaxID=933095 RepID=A0AAI8VL71_9PEZI|nr:Uu.00g005000.m01.CDS01 [Anthostomella pinea]